MVKNKPNLTVVHRQTPPSTISLEEVYQQLSEVKKDLEEVVALLDQHLNTGRTSLTSCKNRKGDTGKTSIASFG